MNMNQRVTPGTFSQFSNHSAVQGSFKLTNCCRNQTSRMATFQLLLGMLLALGTQAIEEINQNCAGPGQFCGNHNVGPKCCSGGQYCQPWNPAFYQCVSQPAKCGVPEVGITYGGNEIADISGLQLPEECCNRCADTLGCKAFTFISSSWGNKTHCYLKGDVSTKENLAGAVSAAVTSPRVASCSTQVGGYCGNKDGSICCPYGSYCQPWSTGYYQCIKAPLHCSTQLTDTDFYGNDIDVVYSLHPTGCCDKCTQTMGCVGYTFVNNHPGQTACYLKRSIDGKRRSVGVVSRKVDLTRVSHIQVKIRRGEARARAVNLGGWLVSEYWMSWDSYVLWEGVPTAVAPQGEYSVMKYLGKEAGTAAFEGHWQTWITESDIQEIASTGVLNTVRVPVGYWIIRDGVDSPGDDDDMFAPGGLKYLDSLINDWAVKYNLAVIVSLHAHQGSQNGYAHSAPVTLGTVGWSSSQANVNNSLKFATFIADRYKDSEAFLGLNLMNEPAPPTDRKVLVDYYVEAYNQIRSTGNNCIILVSPLATEQNPSGFDEMIGSPEYENVWNEIHAYFIWGYEHKSEAWILDHLDTYKRENLQQHSHRNRLFLGEWSMGGPPDEKGVFEDIGCLHELGRKQLAIYNEEASGGWAFWSWRHSDENFSWSLRTLVRYNDLSFSFELS